MSSLFTLNALKNLKQTGSLFSSSNTLANKLVETINPDENVNIIELGAGNGIVTKHILKKISQDSKLHTFEINENFIINLNKIEDQRLKVYNACVSNLTNYFPEQDVDFVISSLPLANIDKEFKKELFKNIKHILKPNGRFIQYQYTKKDFKLIKENFPSISTKLCIKNLPPAFVYNCINRVK